MYRRTALVYKIVQQVPLFLAEPLLEFSWRRWTTKDLNLGTSKPKMTVTAQVKWGNSWKHCFCQRTHSVKVQVAASELCLQERLSPCPPVGVPTVAVCCSAICLNDYLSLLPLTLILPQPHPSCFYSHYSKDGTPLLTTFYSSYEFQINYDWKQSSVWA